MAASPLADSTGPLSLIITVDGEAKQDKVLVTSVLTRHETNRIPSAVITIVDGDMPDGEFPLSDSATFAPGAEVCISAGYDGSVTQIFKGVIIKHGVKIDSGNKAQLVIECRDKALAMTVGRRNANFVDKTDSDIITSLIGGHAGLSATVDSTSITYKELVQYYVSDWDYMMTRAEANGLLVTVDAGAVSVKAPDVSTAPVLLLTYGIDMQSFEAEMDARWQLLQVTGTSLGPRHPGSHPAERRRWRRWGPAISTAPRWPRCWA
jgi:phage protein D